MVLAGTGPFRESFEMVKRLLTLSKAYLAHGRTLGEMLNVMAPLVEDYARAAPQFAAINAEKAEFAALAIITQHGLHWLGFGQIPSLAFLASVQDLLDDLDRVVIAIPRPGVVPTALVVKKS